MDMKIKARCWCCEVCTHIQRVKRNKSGDSQDVFLPPSGSLENGPEESAQEMNAFTKPGLGRSALDSGIPSTTGENDGCIPELDLETTGLNGSKHSFDDDETLVC